WAHFGTRKGDIRPSQPQIRQKLFIPSKLHPWPLFQGSLPRGSLIPDEQVLTPDDDYTWLHEQVQALDSRERHLLQLRYGEEKNRSYSEVAGCMGMTKECAQSLERRALRKLRRRLTPVLNPRGA
ncbi:TPA: sigma factor-like helix-turn-helix DNA-binding protein, partial [Synechococcus sp. WH 5701]|uniref:sigma factor-like helix-turn-helix DNA-binding protein n=2 Tax=Synechococcus TaxID=1129 RepID=UPI003C39730B